MAAAVKPDASQSGELSGGASPAIEMAGLKFGYESETTVSVDKLAVAPGDSLAIIGPSGCGKTTLLHLMAGLLKPSAGVVRMLGQDLSELSGSEIDRFRGRHSGLIFQRFHLLPALSIRDNIVLAQRLARKPVNWARVDDLIEQMDLGAVCNRRPSMLSQGQAQRAAIARALAHEPQLVMADEPTSALDDQRAAQALSLLSDAVKLSGAALVVVTHDQRVRGQLDHEYEMAP